MARVVVLGSSKSDLLLRLTNDPSLAFDIWGLDGNDTLIGGLGDDILRGGAGQDLLIGGGGRDLLLGGDGQDTLVGGNQGDTLDGGNGQDLLIGGSGADLMQGGAGQDDLFGGAGSDTLEGGDGQDKLSGGGGNDWLLGGAGEDELLGGAGDDVLRGGTGNDKIDGGSGRDVAEFAGMRSQYQITDAGNGAVTVRGVTGAGQADGRDALTSVELLRFADGTIEVNGVPTTPSITGFSEDTGMLGDGLTADRSITLTGTAPSRAQVEIFVDGASQGVVTAGTSGAWSFTSSALADGQHSFEAQATKGGLTSAISMALSLTIDGTAPAAPSLGLAASSDSGVRGDDITAFHWTDLVGHGEVGATVSLLGTDINDHTFRQLRASSGIGLRIEIPGLNIPVAIDVGWPWRYLDTDDRDQVYFSIG
ncbi:MAG: Ig-like domain-containing protein, partial [Roseococcus sp.]